MPALKPSVIHSWRGLYNTAFCDSKRLNSPTQNAPFWSSLAKMLLPRHCYQQQLHKNSLEWPVWQVMLPGAMQHPLGDQPKSAAADRAVCCSGDQSPSGHPANGRAGTARWSHDLWPAAFWLSSAHQTNPMKYSPARSWSITITSPRASLQNPVCCPGPGMLL